MKIFKQVTFCLLTIYLTFGVINQSIANDTIQFNTNEFNANKSLVIKLPESYQQSPNRHYPVVYLLNANDFYFGDITEHFEQTITRLTSQNRIPESIVVYVNNKSWYQDAINQGDSFTTFLTDEAITAISSKYRVLNKHILVGHSYTGAFMAKSFAKLSKAFTHQLIISPIFPDVDFIRGAANAQQPSMTKYQQALLFVDPQNQLDVSLLTDMLSASQLPEYFDVSVEQHTGHFTVLPVAITKGMAKIYADFLLTEEKSTPLSLEQIKSQYLAVQNKYQQPTERQDIDSIITAFASSYLEQGYFEQAFDLWQHSKTKFRHYFINRAAQRFMAQHNYQSAEQVWLGLAKIFPNSPYVWQHLLNLADTTNNNKLKQHATLGFDSAVKQFTQQDHAMWLAYIEQTQSINQQLKQAVLSRVLQQEPNNEKAQSLLLKQHD